MDRALELKIAEWRKYDKDPKTLSEIDELVALANKNNDFTELRARMLNQIEFGTAGLRAKMCAGFGRMSDLVIIQTTQGLAAYLLELHSKHLENTQPPLVVVGFDTRHNSQRHLNFTNFCTCGALTVQMGAVNGDCDGKRWHACRTVFQVHAQPFVPFAVRLLSAACDMMVTASHNPKDDNGYKVYWSNGAQILTPHDHLISESIVRESEPRDTSWDTSVLAASPLVSDPLAAVEKAYYNAQLDELLFDRALNEAAGVRAVYTAIHGVGTAYAQRIVCEFGFTEGTLVEVGEQCGPNGDFPTVKLPNLEEGPDTLQLAQRLADARGILTIVANDPDADRFAMAEKSAEGGTKWRIMTGNELGIALGWWCFHVWRARNPHADAAQLYMFGSTVSTHFIAALARHEGFHYEETLTGFKWMGNRALEVLAKATPERPVKVLYAFEEAIGYMCGARVFDKDGISALATATQLLAWLHSSKRPAALREPTLAALLDYLFDTYGYHTSLNSYYFCYEPATIKSIFDRLRTWDGSPKTYPKQLGKFQVKNVRDLTVGFDSAQPDCKPVLPVSASSQMVTFWFALQRDGAEIVCPVTIRTSGTEPKIKFYSELAAPPLPQLSRQSGNWPALDAELRALIDAMVDEFLQPSLNHLKPRNS